MFKLDLFDFEKNEVIKSVQRDFCPTYLYIEFEKVREEVQSAEITSDVKIIDKLCPAFLKLFPELTKDEYYKNTVIGDLMYIFGQIVNKSSTLTSFPRKNG